MGSGIRVKMRLTSSGLDMIGRNGWTITHGPRDSHDTRVCPWRNISGNRQRRMPNGPVCTRLDTQDGPWCVRQSSKLSAWNHILLYLVCVERVISGVMLDEILIPEFVEKILPSVFLQSLPITASTSTRGAIVSTTDLHVVEDCMS